MLKETAVSSLGPSGLLLPAWVKSALAANDRLKLYLSMIQAAVKHASVPDTPSLDWGAELASVGLRNASWLHELTKTAYLDGDLLVMPQLASLLTALSDDLKTMARPLCEGVQTTAADWVQRRDAWLQRLTTFEEDEGLTREHIQHLTHGDRKIGDSFHLLVMDLHKALNALASELATENLDGAHVWQVQDADRPMIQAFMLGLNRTAPLKFSHPGLDTAVTRDGEKLLIQNDIGTNDAHVLVIEVQQLTVALTYSDLHRARFAFFCSILERVGFEWKLFDPVTTSGLNNGKPYHLGKGTLHCEDVQSLLEGLQAVGSRIVFLIDWNRARKALKPFLSRSLSLEVLSRATEKEWGHMAWLLAGGQQLVYNAMQAVDGEAFRIGDRLDEVIGETEATGYILDLMRVASQMLLQQQPMALIADEARLLLSQVLRRHTFDFDLLAEHAAYGHALAQKLSETLEVGLPAPAETTALVARAKAWERRADHVLMDARQRAARQHRWDGLVDILEKADGIADALEEAIFILSLATTPPLQGLPTLVCQVLQRLASTTLTAIQDQIKAIEIGRHLNEHPEARDSEVFLQTLWRMLRAEKQCDELMRDARLTILQTLYDRPVELSLANDLAARLEEATDSLLEAGYALRAKVFSRTGVTA